MPGVMGEVMRRSLRSWRLLPSVRSGSIWDSAVFASVDVVDVVDVWLSPFFRRGDER